MVDQEQDDLGLSSSIGGETFGLTNGFVHAGRQADRKRPDMRDSSRRQMNPRGIPARIGKAQGLNLAPAASCYAISFVLSSGADVCTHGPSHASGGGSILRPEDVNRKACAYSPNDSTRYSSSFKCSQALQRRIAWSIGIQPPQYPDVRTVQEPSTNLFHPPRQKRIKGRAEARPAILKRVEAVDFEVETV
jgi:hypothetical protein